MWRQGKLDLKSPETFVEYFNRLHGRAEQDALGIMALESELRFEDTADEFRIIRDSGEPVVAPFGEDWERRVKDIRYGGISRDRMRRLQPFLVSLYPQEIQALLKAGAVEKIEDTFYVLAPQFNLYSERWGFGWKGPLAAEPESLIV
jgi:hypothetical protein